MIGMPLFVFISFFLLVVRFIVGGVYNVGDNYSNSAQVRDENPKEDGETEMHIALCIPEANTNTRPCQILPNIR